MPNQKNVLNIAFSLGSIIDTKKAKQVFKEEGIDAFHAILKKHKDKNSIFSPGPALGLFMALRKLDRSVPDSVLKIKFGLVSRIDANPSIQSVIIDSMQHYLDENKENDNNSYGFDLIALTGGEETFPFLGKKVFNADLVFTTSEDSAKKLYTKGFNAVSIPNRNSDINKELYDKRNGSIMLFADYDGVLGDSKSESIYQEALKDLKDPINAFLEFEQANRNIPMELGPLGMTIKKLSRVVKYQKQQGLIGKDELLNITVVTARNGQALTRFNKTIEHNDIAISQLYMMEGQNKNFLLQALAEINEGKNLLFLDDSEIHFKRSSELSNISSGWVPNDENTKEIINIEVDVNLNIK